MGKIFDNNEKLESHRTHEVFLDISFGCWSGLLTRKHVAAKLATLQKQFLLDVKEVLSSSLDDLEISSWSLDYSSGKQRIYTYYTPSSDDEKLERIKLLDRKNLCCASKEKDVFLFSSYDEAEDAGFNEDEQ